MSGRDVNCSDSPKRTCFFITPIGAAESSERRRADNLLDHVITPALEKEFRLIRADQIDEPGSINDDIIRLLFESELVIADLTGLNSNVMYELGVRHSFNKPIVQIAQTGQKLPFDVAQ